VVEPRGKSTPGLLQPCTPETLGSKNPYMSMGERLLTPSTNPESCLRHRARRPKYGSKVGPTKQCELDTTMKKTTPEKQDGDTKIVYVGIDVSKDKLDTHCREWDEVRTFENNAAGFRKLHSSLPGGHLHLLSEASGGYEAELIEDAWARGIAVSRLVATRVREFAKSMGYLAKTDAIDAGVITHFGETRKPSPMEQPSELQRKLTAAVRRRESIVHEITAQKNSLGGERDSWVRQEIKTTINFLERRKKRIEEHIDKLIAGDPDMAAKRERIEQVSGIDPVTSAVLLGECHELGNLTGAQASSLAGLAPFNRDSGTYRGKRKIIGGRGRLRRALYMPALTAVRHNPILKEFYTRLLKNGKQPRVAITAVMRKLVCLVNRLLSDPGFELSKPEP